MLVKRIVCRMEPERRDRFDSAQRAWAPLRHVTGLVFQVGGWADPGTACLLAVWSDGSAYESFMKHLHDTIVDRSGQGATYESIDIAVGKSLIRMPGSAATLREAAAGAALLRVADCRVLHRACDRFVRAQLEVWVPGMAAAPGMLGGLFSTLAVEDETSPRYLVTTLWESLAAHETYVEQHLPGLRELADSDRDLESIEGLAIRLEPAWTVIGPGRD